MSQRRSLHRLVALLTLLCLGFPGAFVASGDGGPVLIWPMAVGESWLVTQGYNTVFHGGDGVSLGDRGDKFAFDLVRADGTSSLGQPVYAAQDGVLGPNYWMLRVYEANGVPTSYYLYYGHIELDPELKARYDSGESVWVSRRQRIGQITTNPDSGPHLHFGVAEWAGSGAASPNFPDDPGWLPQPFTSICGTSYPFSGEVNQYLNTVVEPCPPLVTLVSVASDGTQGDQRSMYEAISGDGRFVTFWSEASNLVADDTNWSSDIFVHDRQEGQTERVSVASDGSQGNAEVSAWPDSSADGRFVAFASYSSNLVPGDTNDEYDIFVHDRQTGETTRVSVSSSGAEATRGSMYPFISGDGRYVSFISGCPYLVSGDTNASGDAFFHDRQTGETVRVSVSSGGAEANNSSSWPVISADGRYVAFRSPADNLVPGDTNGCIDVFVHDLQTRETTRVSVASDGTQGNDINEPSQDIAISADGRFVAFAANASNLVPDDTNWAWDIFVHDRQTGETTRVSVANDGTEANDWSGWPAISGDGRYVAFHSMASNLVADDTNGVADVFVRDRLTGQTMRVSVGSDGSQAYHYSETPAISSDGKSVAFISEASLVPEDTIGHWDVYVHERESGPLSISGRVTDASANPISDVTVSIAPVGSATTDANGAYTITGLIAGTYTTSPSKPGYTFAPVTRTVAVPPDATGQDFVGALPDIGFEPDPDGYSFSNLDPEWGLWPLPPALFDFTMNDMRRMFGDEAVCTATVGSFCFYNPIAEIWNARVSRKTSWGGHCDGIASTSLRFFKLLDSPDDFQVGASNTHDLELASVRRHVSYYHAKQVPDPVSEYKHEVVQKTPSEILAQLAAAMSNGSADPTTLFVRSGTRGHTITPYAIEDQGDGVYWVKVYDNNHPDDEYRHVEIDTDSNTWSYDMGAEKGTWTGDATTHSLGVVPVSKYAEPSVCPWCSTAKALSGAESGQVWLSGRGHLLITDSQGRRIGYIGDQLVNEVPGAYESIIDGGLGIEIEPVYTLPLTESYSILLDGQPLTQTETVQVTQFGPGYAVAASDVTLTPLAQDYLTIATDGTALTYQAGDAKDATLTLALDHASDSYQLDIGGADIGAGNCVTVTADVASGRLAFSNRRADGGVYQLDVKRVSDVGIQLFTHSDVVIAASDTHIADYGAWDGSGAITLYIDQGSNGSIDDTMELDNEWHKLYLPLILRSG